MASRFNFTYRYIEDVLSINNPEFENYLGKIYPVELEFKDTTESNTSASYLDLLLPIERDDQLNTSIYDKHDDFNFHNTKEYATIDAIMAYLNLTPLRIKVDRIFNGLNFTLYGENTCV